MFAGPTLTFAASLIDRNLCMRITVKSTYEMHTCVGVCVCLAFSLSVYRLSQNVKISYCTVEFNFAY